MKYPALTTILALVAAVLTSGVAGAQPMHELSARAAPKKQQMLLGFYKNRTVEYSDYGVIKLRPGNKLARCGCSRTAPTASARSWTAHRATRRTPRYTR